MLQALEKSDIENPIRPHGNPIKFMLIGAAIIAIVGSAFLLILVVPDFPVYDPLPASEFTPNEETLVWNLGSFLVSARISCDVFDSHTIDFFEVSLVVIVNNTGMEAIQNFRCERLSIFRDDHWHYFTFGLVPTDHVIIEPGGSAVLTYEGDRTLTTIDGITDIGRISAYGRVLLTYNDVEAIITTSLFKDIFPIE